MPRADLPDAAMRANDSGLASKKYQRDDAGLVAPENPAT
jgi:hypothetical protein